MKLLHGDCFEVMSGLATGSVDCILTDPPYGILKHKIETEIDIPRFISECHRLLKKGGFLAFFGRQPTLTTWNYIASQCLNFKHEIIWYKRQRSSPMGDMGRVHENISIFCKGRRHLNVSRIPYTDLKESLSDLVGGEGLRRMIGQLSQPYKNQFSYESALRFLEIVQNGGDLSEFYDSKGGCRNESVTMSKKTKNRVKSRGFASLECAVLGIKPQSVVSFMSHNKISFDSSGRGEGEFNLKHPTVKPVPLLEWLIELLTTPNQLIIDPFLGTGTTAIACKNMGRRCIGIEIDSEYFKIAQRRFATPPNPPKKDNPQLSFF